MNLIGKVALVTGAGRTVGRAIALELAARGAHVAVHDQHSKHDADEVVAAIEAAGGVGRAFCVDLTNVLEIQWLARWIEEQLGYVDVLVNSASERFETPLATTSDADWDRLIGSNARAPFQTIRRFAPTMINRGGGHIVNVTDVHAEHALPGYSIYCASKAALWMLTKSFALELAPTVRVNAVAPGATTLPADVARAVRLLVEADDQQTGTVVTIDGGKEPAG